MGRPAEKASPAEPDGMSTLRSAQRQYRELKRLGDCYAALRDHRRARQYYNEAACAAPEQSGPYVGLGVLSMQAQRLDEAERAFRIALRMQPDCPEALRGLAAVYHSTGRYPQAFQTYLKCLHHDPDNLLALLGLFQSSREMGTFAQIIHFLEVYLDKHPEDPAVRFCLASLYAREGRLPEARADLETVLAAQPDNAEAARLLDEVRRALHSAPSSHAEATHRMNPRP